MRFQTFLELALIVLLTSFRPAHSQFFVDIGNESGNEDGLTWETAFPTIQPAIAAAANAGGGEVWVASGFYDEERTSGFDIDTGSLVVSSGVALLGGFDGTELSSDSRDADLNVTTISGATSLGGEPANHVVIMDSNTRIEGFTIRDGNADERSLDSTGGLLAEAGPVTIRCCTFIDNTANYGATALEIVDGLVEDCRFESNLGGPFLGTVRASTTTFRRCEIRNNTGVGLSTNDEVVLEDCVFEGNTGSSGAGALELRDEATVRRCIFIDNEGEDAGAIQVGTQFSQSDVTITGCTFVGNRSMTHGGAIYIERSKMAISNSLFIGNSAADVGGAIFGDGFRADFGGGETDAIAVVTNSAFYGNTAVNGGDVFSGNDFDVVSQNSIFWNNCPEPFHATDLSQYSFGNCIVEGGIVDMEATPLSLFGNRVINVAPQFVDAAGGDFMLSASSPAINTGSDTVFIAPEMFINGPFEVPDTDIDGVMRPQPENGAWDLGAYEFVPGETGPGMAEESLCPAEGEGMSEGSTEGEGETEGTTEGSTEGMNEGAGEGMPEGATEGGNEGSNEGSSEGGSEGNTEGTAEGDSEGSTEGMAEGASEGSAGGDTEGNGDTPGGCPWNNDAVFAPPTDSARGNAGTILVLVLTGFVLLRRGKGGVETQLRF